MVVLLGRCDLGSPSVNRRQGNKSMEMIAFRLRSRQHFIETSCRRKMSGSTFHILALLSVAVCLSNARADAASEGGHCFGVIDSRTTIALLTQRCGEPAREVGSGLYIPVWDLSDGSSLSVSATSSQAPIFSARRSKTNGAVEVIYDRGKTGIRNKNDEDVKEPTVPAGLSVP